MRSLAFLLLLGQARSECDFEDCYSCAKSCSWCAKDNRCHDKFFVNLVDPCFWDGGDVNAADKCPNQPKPNASLSKPNSTFATKVLSQIFKTLKITDVDVSHCVADVGNSEVHFRDFALDLKQKKYKSGVEELGRGLSALSNAVTTCGVQEVQQKIDALAASVKWANISTKWLDASVKVLVGASDLWKDLEAVQAAVEKTDPTAVGDALSQLLSDWTSIEGGCKADQSVCKFIDGLLRVLAVTAKEVTPCEDALKPAFNDFNQGSQLFKAKAYKNATAKFAAGLDVLAKATMSDACGLKTIANTIGNLSPKLEAAIVKVTVDVFGDSKVTIVVGEGANIYDALYTLVVDFENQDYAGVGMQLGRLLAELKASSCQTEMCLIVEGLLGSFQVGFTDLEACKSDLDKAWTQMGNFTSLLHNKQWGQSMLALGDVVQEIGDSVNACGVQPIGAILQDTATKLHHDQLASDLGVVVQLLVKGADITPDIQKIIVDIDNKQWAALGSDLGTLSTWMNSTDCQTFTCKIIEGLLNEADMALTNLKPCEDTLRSAESNFVDGAELWSQGKHQEGLKYLASGINQLAKAVDACGLPQELKYLQQEANVLGLGNVSGIGEAVSILVHGSDIAETMFSALQAFTQHDYRTAGADLQKALAGMYKWTTGHLCTSDACYVFNGVLQYLADLAKDIQNCKRDFKDMFTDFENAYHELSEKPKANSKLLGFAHNKTAISAGIEDIGKGIQALATSVGDCHLEELVSILAALAVKLGGNKEIEIIKEVLKIFIDGVPIEKEIASALEDYARHNWPGFGYNVIKLIKDLFKSEHVKMVSDSAIVI